MWALAVSSSRIVNKRAALPLEPSNARLKIKSRVRYSDAAFFVQSSCY
jgi:hypothetical protein